MSRKWLTTLGVAATAAVATLAFVAASAASTSHRTTVPTAAPNAITQIGSVGVTYKIGKFAKRGKRLVAIGQVVAQFTPTTANPAGLKPATVTQPFTATATTLRRFAAANRICPVLNLSLQQLNLNLLGLIVHLAPVHLTITANSRRWRSRQPVLLAFAREGVARNDREEADEGGADERPRHEGRAHGSAAVPVDLRWEVDADNVSDGLAARDLSDSRLDARSARPESARADGAPGHGASDDHGRLDGRDPRQPPLLARAAPERRESVLAPGGMGPARPGPSPSSPLASARANREAARSEPRRDRAARLPRLPRARDRDRGGRARGRRRLAARALGGRDRSRSPRTSTRRSTSARRRRPARTRSTRATASSPRTPTSRRRSRPPGSIWVGPPPAALRAGGDKLEAKRIAREAGVPVVPRASRTSSASR